MAPLANLTVFTISDKTFVHLLNNFALHMRHTHPLLSFEMHCADAFTYDACTNFPIPHSRGVCVSSPLSDSNKDNATNEILTGASIIGVHSGGVDLSPLGGNYYVRPL